MATAIGLDIGSSSIKVVRMTLRRGRPKVLDFVRKEIPHQSSEDRDSIISSNLKDIFGKKKFRGKVVSSLPLAEATVRKITVPFTDNSKIEQMISFEAEAYLPFPVEEAIVEFYPLRRRGSDTELVTIALRRETVARHLRLLREAGIDPVAIGLDGTALFNAHSAPRKEGKGRTIALIDMGAEATIIDLVKDGVLSFSRSIRDGGDNLTRCIAESCHLSWEEAERKKIDEGSALDEAIRKGLEPLEKEISRSFTSFLMESGESKIDEILLSGEAGQLRGLDKFWSEKLAIEISMAPPPEISSEFKVACGLAVQGLKRSKVTIDFRRKELLPDEASWKKAKRGLIATAILASAIIVLSVSNFYVRLFSQQKSYGRLKKEMATIFSQTFPGAAIPSAVQLEEMRNRLQIRKKQWENLRDVGESFSVLKLLKEIHARIPAQIELEMTEMELNRDGVRMSGRTSSFEAVDRITKNLSSSPYFAQVRRESSRSVEGGKAVEFKLRIECREKW